METRKIMAFVSLAETLNYTETAIQLYTSQATISKQIMALEKELGTGLFIRAHRKIRLTEAGQQILPFMRSMLDDEHQIRHTISVLKSRQQKSIAIRAIPTISQYRAFNRLTTFAHEYPEVAINFAESESKNLLMTLDQGEADVIFMRSFAQLPPKYEVASAEKDQFVALVPADHPLAQQRSIAVGDLALESFMMLAESTDLYQPVMSLLKDQQICPNITYKGRRIDLILQMINRGMGVSIMMEKSFDLTDFNAVVAVPLVPTVTCELVYVRLKASHTALENRFWQYLLAH